MDKIKRNERIGAMARILTAAPNHIFTLGRFCGMFEAAKSTVSEDVELLRNILYSGVWLRYEAAMKKRKIGRSAE